jgi:hypothetical protein
MTADKINIDSGSDSDFAPNDDGESKAEPSKLENDEPDRRKESSSMHHDWQESSDVVTGPAVSKSEVAMSAD